MKRFSIVLLICTLALTFCFPGAVFAQGDEELPDPGITPDSPFYFLDIWGKKLGLFFAFGSEAKVQKSLQYAEERLAELNAMHAQNKAKAMIQAANEYNNCLAIATRHMEQTRANGIDTSETVALAASKHIRFFGNVTDNVSENATGIMTQTRERVRICQETAIRTMAQGDPEKAIRTNLMLMEQQLNRIGVRAEDGEITRLQEELQEFERLNNLGQEISQIAKGLGQDTTVDQLVGQATAYHLAILAEVHGRVQEQAQQAIENAMQVCVENHERVVTALKEKNMLGQLPEEPSIPDEISEKIRQRTSSGESGQKP